MYNKEELKKIEDFCFQLNINMIGYEVGFGRTTNYKFKFDQSECRFYFTVEWISIFGNEYSSWYFFNPIVYNVDDEIKRAQEHVKTQILKWMELDKYRK